MIKVLHKAFDIVELLAASPEKPLALGEIAGRLDLNMATCANIIKTLVARGMVEQIAPKKGYLLGPLAYSLAARGPYRKDIVKAARDAMAVLAEKFRETVVLATLRNGRRYVLHTINVKRILRIEADAPYFTDTYHTATGRLLLAHLGESELAEFLVTHGLPGKSWFAASNEKKLRLELKRIRKACFAEDVDHPDVAQLAVPVREGEKVVAALGLPLPLVRYRGENKKHIRAAMAAAAGEVSAKLTRAASEAAQGGGRNSQA